MGSLNFFCPGVGNLPIKKNCPGVLRGGGWSGLELADTLYSESSTLLVNRYIIFNKSDKHIQLHIIVIYTGALPGQGPQVTQE